MIHPTPYNGALFRGLRIGLLGGSFNPAHAGHFQMSVFAMKHLRLDFVWWLVSPQNPLKDSSDMAPADLRLVYARSLIGRHPRLCASSIEEKFGTRFTLDTLRALQKHMPGAHFVWLMGADNLLQFPKWKRWGTLFSSLPVAIFRRPGSSIGRGFGKVGVRFANSFSQRSSLFFTKKKSPAWLIFNNRHNSLSGTALRRSLSSTS